MWCAIRGGLFILAIAAPSAHAKEPEMVFATDSKPAQQVDSAALLQAVCPGAVGPDSNNHPGCAVPCPEKLEAVTFGHFLSPASEDAVLWMPGCESHSSNNGGTVLLTKKSRKWTMLWYKPAIQTARCHKVLRPDRREILVCIATDGVTALYTEDLLNPVMAGSARDGSFFTAFDDTPTCGWKQGDPEEPEAGSVIRSHIDKVEFSRNGAGTPSISVTASLGRKEMDWADIDACSAGNDEVLPAMTAYRMDFRYDGRFYKPTPSSIGTIRIFDAR
jgi:hypothetical protein